MGARGESWKHPNPKKQLVIQQLLLSDSITSPLSLSFFLSASISPSIPPVLLLIKFLPCLPHFPSKKKRKKKNGQQKAFSLRSVSVWLQSRMCAHSLTPNPMRRSDIRKRHTEQDERRNKEQEVGIKRNKRQAETEEMSLSVRERHEWAGALIIDRMIKADEEGFFPQ